MHGSAGNGGNQVDPQTVILHFQFPFAVYFGLVGYSVPQVHFLKTPLRNDNEVPSDSFGDNDDDNDEGVILEAMRYILQQSLQISTKLSLRFFMVEHPLDPTTGRLRLLVLRAIQRLNVTWFSEDADDKSAIRIAHLDSIYSLHFLFPPTNLVGTGAETGTVISGSLLGVDVGWEGVAVMPVSLGHCMYSAAVDCPLALKSTLNIFRSLVLGFGKLFRYGGGDSTVEVMDGELRRCGFRSHKQWLDLFLCVASTESTPATIEDMKVYINQRDCIVVPAAARYLPLSLLLDGFQASLWQTAVFDTERGMQILPSMERDIGMAEEFNLPSSILDCVMTAGVDMRRELLSNIVVTGTGGRLTQIPGFYQSLKQRLQNLMSTDDRFSTLKHLRDCVRLIKTPLAQFDQGYYAAEMIPWLGANIAASQCPITTSSSSSASSALTSTSSAISNLLSSLSLKLLNTAAFSASQKPTQSVKQEHVTVITHDTITPCKDWTDLQHHSALAGGDDTNNASDSAASKSKRRGWKLGDDGVWIKESLLASATTTVSGK